MPRVCTICSHPQRPEIDRALVDANTSIREIAKQFSVSPSAVDRHLKAHVPAHLSKAREAEAVAGADDLLADVRSLQAKALSLLTKAEVEGDYATALRAVREARACIELLLEVEGELDRRSVVNVIVSPQWLSLRATLVTALRPFPDASAAIAHAIAAHQESLE